MAKPGEGAQARAQNSQSAIRNVAINRPVIGLAPGWPPDGRIPSPRRLADREDAAPVVVFTAGVLVSVTQAAFSSVEEDCS